MLPEQTGQLLFVEPAVAHVEQDVLLQEAQALGDRWAEQPNARIEEARAILHRQHLVVIRDRDLEIRWGACDSIFGYPTVANDARSGRGSEKSLGVEARRAPGVPRRDRPVGVLDQHLIVA